MLNTAPRVRESTYSDDVDFSGFQGTYKDEEVEVDIDGCVLMIPAVEVRVYGVDVSYGETDIVFETVTVTGVNGEKRELGRDGTLGSAVDKWLLTQADTIREWAAERVRWDS